jgi:P27 family predicted phage terminase small subunit
MSTRRLTVPKPPADLKPDAIARWKTVAPGLAKRGDVDLEQLRTYCQVWARWREAEDGITKAGQLTKTPSGRVVASPLLTIANQAAQQVRALEDRLGIGGPAVTPAQAEPASNGITRRELAQRLAVHMMTVTKWERDGMPIAERGRKGKPSAYREADVRAWLSARETAAAKSGLVDVAQERARKERAQATLAEQSYKARERELLPAAEVEKVWNAEVQAVRAAILATYTTRADRIHRAAVIDGVAGVETELKAMAYELLRELSSDDKTEQGHAA